MDLRLLRSGNSVGTLLRGHIQLLILYTSLQLQGELQSKAEAPRLYRGVFHGVGVILKNEGVKGLFRGIGCAVRLPAL